MSVTVAIPDDVDDISAVNLYESDEYNGCYSLVYSITVTSGINFLTYPQGSSDKWYKVKVVYNNGTEGPFSCATRGTQTLDEFIAPRISGRLNNIIRLNCDFYRNGILTDPYAIRLVRIYKQSVDDANLLVEIPFTHPESSEYPHPASSSSAGKYEVLLSIPDYFPVPDIYFDVWYYIPTSEYIGTGTEVDLNDESLWKYQCNKFWVYPDGWYLDDGLITPRISFDPIDVKFRKGDYRPLEVGLMPQPLYDYDHNLIMPMIPYLQPSITIYTIHNEIIDKKDMEIALRQGTYRSNPFVTKFMLDTNKYLKGTYNYNIELRFPNGQIIISPKFTFTIL